MGNPAGVKRDVKALEKRRLEAGRLLEKSDLKQSEVARRLRVCRQTVSRWWEEFKFGVIVVRGHLLSIVLSEFNSVCRIDIPECRKAIYAMPEEYRIVLAWR